MKKDQVSYNVIEKDSEGLFFGVNVIRGLTVSNCNRDEAGSPKTVTFGDSLRARHSSASVKRPMRMSLKNNPRVGRYFRGVRTMRVEEEITRRLVELGMAPDSIEACVQEFSEVLRGGKTKETKASKAAKAALTAQVVQKDNDVAQAVLADEETPKESEKDAESDERKRALMFVSEGELDVIAKALFDNANGDKIPFSKKELIRLIKGHALGDGLDIRIFGRMCACVPEVTEEGASYVSHSVSTNQQANEEDYFTAIDDLVSGAGAGAAHMDNAEFNAPVMYSHATYNLKDLFKGYDHLTIETKRAIVEEVIMAFVDSIPTGKKHVMFSDTPASYASVIRFRSQPFTLVNAFNKAVTDKGEGVIAASIDALKDYWAKVKVSYADHLEASQVSEFTLGKDSINDFASRVANELIK